MTESHSNFANMPAKQKISAIIFLIIGIFIIWEVIGMFRGSSSHSTTVASAPPTAKAAPVKMSEAGPAAGPTSLPPGMNKTVMPNTPAMPPSSPASNEAASFSRLPPNLSKPMTEQAPPPPTAYLMQQQQAQSGYISALNELQMLKIQREIAETNQAIQAAKLATVTTEKNISDLLSPDLMGPPGMNHKMPPGMMAPNSLSMPPSPPGGGETVISTAAPSSYSVQSVTMELNQWHAVLSYKGKFYDVSVGDILSDGSTVTAIDQKGVTLQLGGMEQHIPLTLTDQLSQPASGGSSGPSGPPSGSTSVAPPPGG